MQVAVVFRAIYSSDIVLAAQDTLLTEVPVPNIHTLPPGDADPIAARALALDRYKLRTMQL